MSNAARQREEINREKAAYPDFKITRSLVHRMTVKLNNTVKADLYSVYSTGEFGRSNYV
jgi:hypothetical protein